MESNTLKLKEILSEELPGRSKEIEKLLLWMGQPSERTPPLIYIHGNRAVGKTHAVKKLFSLSGLPSKQYCYISCKTHCDKDQICKLVLYKLTNKVIKFRSFADFVVELENILEKSQETRYLFLELIYNSLWTDCDLVDLLRLLPELYEKCLETINEEEAQIEDWDGLYNSLMPHMKSIFDKSHLLDISSKTGQSPKWVSYLLIAMFLASHIPQKHDIKLFAKESDPRKKRRNGRDIKSEPPHASELERIFAIFYSIYDGMVINSFDLHQQIQLFVDCHMARRTTPFEQLDNPMYLCKVDFNSIKQICKNVDFNIAIYLDGMDM
ncbi:8812_t:CDS:2 [Entrophospora sp. SA101]|nr:14844_t:CDS:2 [Entrophospora sp. SA101]CAJ0828870.1 8812_t:CDS:2 [Entrophospora sp. SA101]